MDEVKLFLIHYCAHCSEPVLDSDERSPATLNGLPMHYECGLRIALGSVGHLKGACSCYGGDEEDPPNMTVREAAKAACNLWLTVHRDD